MLTTFKAYLSKKEQMTPDVLIFRFQLIEPQEINFIAGQYLILMVPQGSGEWARRPYSVLSPETQKNSIDLLVKLIPGGVASEYLRSLSIEEPVEFQGPAGMFTLREGQRNKVFLATGTGIAPIKSMIFSTIHRPTSKIYLFWGLPHYSDIYFFDELKQLTLQFPHIRFYICLSREENLNMIAEENIRYFSLGHVNDVLEENIESWKLKIDNFDYYLCGGRNVVELLRQQLINKQVPANQIYFEKF